jgi:predicted nucleotidyltransferase
MSSLVRQNSQFQLTSEKLKKILLAISIGLADRVSAGYVFGSAATGNISPDSDIDLILVVEKAQRPFVERGFDFLDLFEIYPKLDILVYTKEEFAQQLADSSLGFWKSLKESLRQIV